MSRELIQKSHHNLRRASNSQQFTTAILVSPATTIRDSYHELDLRLYGQDLDNGTGIGIHIAASTPQYSSTFSIWQCFFDCKLKFHQQLAKRRIEQGLRLYNKNKQKSAISKWHSALKQIIKRNDRFLLLGYLYHAYMGYGKYRQCSQLARSQLTIAEEMDSANFRAEAYLNLAKADEKMGNLEKALSHAKQSLYNECDHCHTAALVQITVGSLHLELATFYKALRAFQRAHTIAQRIQDRSLELQIYMRLSELFGRLQDTDKSTMYASKAYNLCRTLHVNELNSRYHRAALLQMASALRKQGELGDAHDYCNNAYRQYESAMNSALSTGDRLCQIEAMDGAAKCLEILRVQRKICNCRPLEFNNKLLETATRIGAKLLMRAVRVRLRNICQSLGDAEQLVQHEKEIQNLEKELQMICGACDSVFGYEIDSLEVLPCAHILHARCFYDITNKKNNTRDRACPHCDKTISSALYLQRFDSTPLRHHQLQRDIDDEEDDDEEDDDDDDDDDILYGSATAISLQ